METPLFGTEESLEIIRINTIKSIPYLQTHYDECDDTYYTCTECGNLAYEFDFLDCFEVLEKYKEYKCLKCGAKLLTFLDVSRIATNRTYRKIKHGNERFFKYNHNI